MTDSTQGHSDAPPPAQDGASGVRRSELQDIARAWTAIKARPAAQPLAILLSDLVESEFKKLGIHERLGEEELRTAWLEAVGPFLGKETRPDTLRRGVLTILARNPSVHFHLAQAKRAFLGKLQERFGAGKIKDLVFKVG